VGALDRRYYHKGEKMDKKSPKSLPANASKALQAGEMDSTSSPQVRNSKEADESIVTSQVDEDVPRVSEAELQEELKDLESAGIIDAEIADEAESMAEEEQEAEAAEEQEVEKPKHKAVAIQVRKAPVHGKKYRNAVKDIDLTTNYPKAEAIELVKKTSTVKFDASIEVHIKLTISNQRGTIVLPAGTGKEKIVKLVSASDVEEFVASVEAGKLGFDVVVATPDAMPKLAKVAKLLGPKGLMPNPKSGTVTADLEKAKAEFASGRVEYKQDKGNVIHLAIGKVSFENASILENLNVLLSALPAPKITSVVLSSTMGPGVRVRI
jgi:large subunit ribosomal protein L1